MRSPILKTNKKGINRHTHTVPGSREKKFKQKSITNEQREPSIKLIYMHTMSYLNSHAFERERERKSTCTLDT